MPAGGRFGFNSAFKGLNEKCNLLRMKFKLLGQATGYSVNPCDLYG